MGMDRLAVGIDLGATAIKAGLISEVNGLQAETSLATDAHEGPERVLDRIAMLIQKLTPSTGTLAGVGIGTPGAINWERTTVSHPPNLPGWDVINVGEALRKRLPSAPFTILENDANVAGLGSAHYGIGKSFNSFIMITLGTGVGGAIIYQNKIFRGATGAAGEIGHMSIDYNGPFARSGVAGAIEAYLGQHFLSRHARYSLMNKRDSIMHNMADDDLHGITPKMLYDAAEKGDEGAIEVLAWAGHKLGCVLGSAVNLLDIRKFVIGGGLSAAGDYILSSARSTIRQYVTPALQDGLQIVQETRGNEVGMLGAGHLVFQYLDENDLPSD